MNLSLEDLIEPLVEARIAKLLKDLANSQIQYSQLANECEQQLNQIREFIAPELKHTLYLYEDTLASSQAILQTQIYLRGFKDAALLFDGLAE
ncbi:MAG: hypothetical protein K0R57_4060 [Paenibacillaceae bacterium]|nr:hypothetical protein [Paenibacillaceae bacterium]